MKQYKKNGIIKSASQIVINKDGFQVINPSEELILADGWEIYTPPIPAEPTEEEKAKMAQEQYESDVVSLIRERYSLDQELAIQRQRDTKPQEFEEYNAYCEECKTKVKKGGSNA